ncbi:(R)-stereoselective amidase [Tepidimonas thermarum]|uniref:(R)-stereoselective amidase n=1 Tax=Tepidimonas thermarum TaxID=335431 RepID=A0A554X3T0_9BURK|nr:nitrilase-related carbon-nitrogen hydrolase [Tepidimonas thermarum]TSE30416.1 (R)-stereoselective amidase [Tepidimonas thermarum]
MSAPESTSSPLAPTRLALWQTEHPAAGDTATALQRLEQAAQQAAARGAHWLVTPEMALTGYLIDPARLAALAEPADGPLAQAVAAIAQRHGVGIVYGWPERHPQGGLPYNAAQAIGPQGQRLAVHRKVHLFGKADAERFTPGVAPAAPFDWGGTRIGLLICYDVEQPAAVRALARQGARLILVSTANMLPYDDAPRLTVPRLAAEHGVAIAYANACGAEGGTRYGGLSTLVGPRGEVRARAGRGAELLIADSPG